jgi:hypothetical protein
LKEEWILPALSWLFINSWGKYCIIIVIEEFNEQQIGVAASLLKNFSMAQFMRRNRQI